MTRILDWVNKRSILAVILALAVIAQLMPLAFRERTNFEAHKPDGRVLLPAGIPFVFLVG